MNFSLKKAVIILVVFLVSSMNVFAMQNSLGKYISTPEYNTFIEAVKNNNLTREQVDVAYAQFLLDVPYGYAQARGTYNYCLYLLEQKDKAATEKGIEYMTQIMDSLEDGFEKETLNLDIICMNCNLYRSLSWGLKLQSVIKSYYETWGNSEVYAVLVQAYSYQNTPAIAGGSNKKAVETFNILLPYTDILEPEFEFSVYMGLVASYYTLREWKTARTWLEKSVPLYPYSPAVIDYTKKITAKLGK